MGVSHSLDKGQTDEVLTEFEATTAAIKGIESKIDRVEGYVRKVEAQRQTLVRQAEEATMLFSSTTGAMNDSTNDILDYFAETLAFFAELVENLESTISNLQLSNAPRELQRELGPLMVPAVVLVFIITASNVLFGFLLAHDPDLAGSLGESTFAGKTTEDPEGVNFLMLFAIFHVALIGIITIYLIAEGVRRKYLTQRRAQKEKMEPQETPTATEEYPSEPVPDRSPARGLSPDSAVSQTTDVVPTENQEQQADMTNFSRISDVDTMVEENSDRPEATPVEPQAQPVRSSSRTRMTMEPVEETSEGQLGASSVLQGDSPSKRESASSLRGSSVLAGDARYHHSRSGRKTQLSSSGTWSTSRKQMPKIQLSSVLRNLHQKASVLGGKRAASEFSGSDAGTLSGNGAAGASRSRGSITSSRGWSESPGRLDRSADTGEVRLTPPPSGRAGSSSVPRPSGSGSPAEASTPPPSPRRRASSR